MPCCPHRRPMCGLRWHVWVFELNPRGRPQLCKLGVQAAQLGASQTDPAQGC